MLRFLQPTAKMISSMAFGAGPLYTNAILSQTVSAAEREHARKASCTILREDSILVEDTETISQPGSHTISWDCTTQAPCSTIADETKPIEETILPLPKESPSYDMAHFLRTTSPPSPHDSPSKTEHQQKTNTAPKRAFHFIKFKRRRPRRPKWPFYG